MKDEFIYMIAYSTEGDSDWYGDFNYGYCPLSKYAGKSNLWESRELPGSSHGYGSAGYIVKTTLKALETLGWQEDYEKYKTTEESWNNRR